ncbi:MAG: 6,7-dimethyl-8-ribityllumazine synthase [Desulfovibrionaceae bacterium]|nr:6,7-dimethyl-8-ribityllumazine synthase [Desulfovibrionaceae bacterium]
MNELRCIEGDLLAGYHTFAIVASRFNDFIVSRLIEGAVDTLTRHGASMESITLYRVPGAFELPLLCKKIAEKNNVHGIIALGAVIRGATPHFDYVANETTKGLAHISLQYGLPISFGVLTTDTIEQAIERAGTKAGNKGAEAALTILEMINVIEVIQPTNTL